ncbi:MAG: hypothetical protein ACRDYB_16770 [Acidimicrobiales bacterium]
MQIQALNEFERAEHHGQKQLCVPFVVLKGDSYRLRGRDLGKVPDGGS